MTDDVDNTPDETLRLATLSLLLGPTLTPSKSNPFDIK